ncbi:MAG TPA: FMN-binding protein [Baekduia sp.]
MNRKIPGVLLTVAATVPPLALPYTALGATSGKLYTGKAYSAHQWGTVQVRIRVSGGRIVNVGAVYPNHKQRSITINTRAIPILKREVLKAQSANVQYVSGASDTSEAYKSSLQSAISKAHL